jgi:hypothetical protein
VGALPATIRTVGDQSSLTLLTLFIATGVIGEVLFSVEAETVYFKLQFL